jgi:hypothetical protein
LFGFESGLSFHGVTAHAEDDYAELVEVFFCVAKLGRFGRSAGSVGFGIEEEDDAFAEKIGERDVVAGVVFQAECGSFVADFQHVLLSVLRAQISRGFDTSQPEKKEAGLKPGATFEPSRQELSEDVVYGLGIGLAACGAHDLAYEKFEDAFVAGFEFGNVVGIFSDDFTGG